MEYIYKDGGVLLANQNSFSLNETLTCGQNFRSHILGEGKFYNIAHGKLLEVSEINSNTFFFYPTTKDEFESIWIPYFDLNTDYDIIKETLAANDFVMRDAVEYAPGIRILKQEFFECLISFIISQNSSIPMIRRVIGIISRVFGNEIGEIDGEKIYSFPTLEALRHASISELRECRTGFRDKYIVDACYKLASGEVDPSRFDSMTTGEIRENLMKIKGVGVKVADCVLLFSIGRFDTFPTDVWIKRIMQHFYFSGKNTNINVIHSLAFEKYGNLAGYAQEYLFYYARQFQIGK